MQLGGLADIAVVVYKIEAVVPAVKGIFIINKHISGLIFGAVAGNNCNPIIVFAASFGRVITAKGGVGKKEICVACTTLSVRSGIVPGGVGLIPITVNLHTVPGVIHAA